MQNESRWSMTSLVLLPKSWWYRCSVASEAAGWTSDDHQLISDQSEGPVCHVTTCCPLLASCAQRLVDHQVNPAGIYLNLSAVPTVLTKLLSEASQMEEQGAELQMGTGFKEERRRPWSNVYLQPQLHGSHTEVTYVLMSSWSHLSSWSLGLRSEPDLKLLSSSPLSPLSSNWEQ